MPKDTALCLACGKKFNKTDSSVQCTVCGLWAHKTCIGMSDEIFNFINSQRKQTGITYWACRPCTAYAQGMNHRVKQLEDEMEEMRSACEKNDCGLQKVQEQVTKLAEKVGNQARQVAGAAALEENSVYEELREREQRRTNVVMYGMKEAPIEYAGRERWDWDKNSCGNLFRALKVDMPENSIKFLRRVGEAGEQPRPLVVGFHEERDKKRALRCDTRNTVFRDVEVCPDLTKKQRQEEANMKKEAVKRNQQLGDEDRAKNLAWQVVGPRGEKRLEKKYVDWEMERGRRGRQEQRGGVQRGRDGTRPDRRLGGQMTRRLTGANSVALGTGPEAIVIPNVEVRMEDGGEEEEMEEEEEEGGASQGIKDRPLPTQTARTRLDSKRKEREEETEEEDMMPPAKH